MSVSIDDASSRCGSRFFFSTRVRIFAHTFFAHTQITIAYARAFVRGRVTREWPRRCVTERRNAAGCASPRKYAARRRRARARVLRAATSRRGLLTGRANKHARGTFHRARVYPPLFHFARGLTRVPSQPARCKAAVRENVRSKTTDSRFRRGLISARQHLAITPNVGICPVEKNLEERYTALRIRSSDGVRVWKCVRFFAKELDDRGTK